MVEYEIHKVVRRQGKTIGFIIYDHLLSKGAAYSFTIEQLAEESKQLNLELSISAVKTKLMSVGAENFV